MKKLLIAMLALVAATQVFADAQKDIPVECGDKVKVWATPKTGYHFLRWKENGVTSDTLYIDNVHRDSTLTALFAINRYEIIFKNGNDTLQLDTVDHGTTPVYDHDKNGTPVKDSTVQYAFKFSGWDPTIYPADKNQIYTAQFDTTVLKYLIKFVNWDGTVLKSDSVEFGSMPTEPATTPTRPGNDSVETYTFAGWSPAISSVTGDQVYTAQYTETAKLYTVTPKIVDTKGNDLTGGTITGSGTRKYNEKFEATVTFNNDCYTFVGWKTDLKSMDILSTDLTYSHTVTADVTLYAVYEKKTYTIKVVSDDPTMGEVDGKKL